MTASMLRKADAIQLLSTRSWLFSGDEGGREQPGRSRRTAARVVDSGISMGAAM